MGKLVTQEDKDKSFYKGNDKKDGSFQENLIILNEAIFITRSIDLLSVGHPVLDLLTSLLLNLVSYWK